MNGLTAPEILRTNKAAGMLGFLQETRMPAELAQWITPAMFILGFLYLDRSIRNVRAESRLDIKDLRVEIVNLRDHMDAQNEALRDRMQNGPPRPHGRAERSPPRPHGPDRGDA